MFSEQNIFKRITRSFVSAEREQFNFIVLKQALERDFTFIVEDLFDGRSPVTTKMIELLLIEN